jgi:sugar lactone lactonase YvrE
VDAAGDVFIADTGNDTLRELPAGGVLTTVAGRAMTAGFTDGTGTAARFREPASVAVDASGNLYVADTLNNTVRKITAGAVTTTLAGYAGNPGSADGTGAAASFSSPAGVAFDASGNAYVADSANNTIRMVTPAGVVTTLAGSASASGSANGTGSAALFKVPTGIAVDASGNVFVADSGNYTIRKITPEGVVTTFAGTAGTSGDTDGLGAGATFGTITQIALDGSGNLYVADTGNGAIRVVSPTGQVSTLVSNFANLQGVAVASSGTVYASDATNQEIYLIPASGSVATLAGISGTAGSKDGSPAVATFNAPTWLALDGGGNLYVSDTGNNTVRKVSATGTVSTVLGAAGSVGSTTGALPGVLALPAGIAVSPVTGMLDVAVMDAILTAQF